MAEYIFRSIREEWELFANFVFGKQKISDVQYREMRNAFFAGCTNILFACKALSSDHIPEDFKIAYLDALLKECSDYKDKLMRDHAERN